MLWIAGSSVMAAITSDALRTYPVPSYKAQKPRVSASIAGSSDCGSLSLFAGPHHPPDRRRRCRHLKGGFRRFLGEWAAKRVAVVGGSSHAPNPTRTPHKGEKQREQARTGEQPKTGKALAPQRDLRQYNEVTATPRCLDTAEATGSIPVAPTRLGPLPGLRNAVMARVPLVLDHPRIDMSTRAGTWRFVPRMRTKRDGRS
jgi:hypothetical protein